MKLNRNNLILFFLIVFGAAMRFWELGKDKFHVDEMFTYNLCQHSFEYILQFGLSQDCNPPLFYLLDRVSMLMFGFTYWGERFPAVVAGILLIPAVYLLGKEVRNELLGLLSAAIVTTLGSMWYYSQFGRAYSMICLFFTLALVIYVKLMHGETTRTNWLLFGLLTTSCLWTHLYALVPLALMWVYLFWIYKWDNVKQTIPTMLLSIPLVGTYYAIYAHRGNIMQGWMGNTIPQLLQYMPLEYFGYSCGVFFPLVGISTWMNRKDNVIGGFVALWILTFAAQLIISLITPVFIRYTLLMVPMLCVVAMEPVARFIQCDEAGSYQKWFIMLIFSLLYFAILIYQAMTIYYLPKGGLSI